MVRWRLTNTHQRPPAGFSQRWVETSAHSPSKLRRMSAGSEPIPESAGSGPRGPRTGTNCFRQPGAQNRAQATTKTTTTRAERRSRLRHQAVDAHPSAKSEGNPAQTGKILPTSPEKIRQAQVSTLQDPTPGAQWRSRKKVRLRMITGTMPTRTIMIDGAAASARRSSDASS